MLPLGELFQKRAEIGNVARPIPAAADTFGAILRREQWVAVEWSGQRPEQHLQQAACAELTRLAPPNHWFAQQRRALKLRVRTLAQRDASFALLSAVSSSRRLELVGFGADSGAGSGYFCQECLTDRPQKNPLHLFKSEKQPCGIANKAPVTRRRDCQRVWFPQGPLSPLPWSQVPKQS